MDGDRVYIKKMLMVENGGLAAVIIDGEAAPLSAFITDVKSKYGI